MTRERARKARVVSLRMERYLCEYACSKYEIDRTTGAVKFPAGGDLSILVWDWMRPGSQKTKAAIDSVHMTEDDGQLKILLPERKYSFFGGTRKHPEYWNHLPKEGCDEIRALLKLHFNFVFHHWMLTKIERGEKQQICQLADEFRKSYRMEHITVDALVKNFYRYRLKQFPQQIRKKIRKKQQI